MTISFNQQFIFLATLFGSKLRCVKPVTRSVSLDEGTRTFELYHEGEIVKVTGILQDEEGLSVFLKQDGCDFEDSYPLDLIHSNFSLCESGFNSNPNINLIQDN